MVRLSYRFYSHWYLAVLRLTYKDNEAKDSTPFVWYGVCATTYLGAMLASNKALQWVNYPTQVRLNCTSWSELCSRSMSVASADKLLPLTDWKGLLINFSHIQTYFQLVGTQVFMVRNF